MPPNRFFDENLHNSSEYIPVKREDALLVYKAGCHCGSCGVNVNLADKPRSCPGENCRKEWSCAIVFEDVRQAGLFDYLRTVNYSAIKRPWSEYSLLGRPKISTVRNLGTRSVENIELPEDSDTL